MKLRFLLPLFCAAIASAQVPFQTSRAIITSNAIVGSPTGSVPVTAFEVDSSLTTSPRGILSGQFNTGTDGARFHGRKARGTRASPLVIVSGDNLTRWVGSGYDGANYLENASIIFGTEGTIASTRIPTNIIFQTATDAAPSVLTTRMTINSAGNTILAGNLLPDASGTRSLGSTLPLVWDTVHANNFRTAGGTLIIRNTFTSTGGDPMIATDTTAGTLTSGTENLILLQTPFSPGTGTAVWNWLTIAPTINQTGGANGITRAIYVNPTLTAAADFRALEITAGNMVLPKTVTAAGTTGAQTINKLSGTVNIAAAGTTVTVTNNLCTVNSIVVAVIRTNDGTATIKNVVPGAGSFVITFTAAATSETSVGFFVHN